MATSFPLPIRVAVGLLVSCVERLGHLPADLPALGVTIAGQTMRASMRIQQQIAELATKGEEVLSGLGDGPDENPPWATFDDDPEPAPATAEAPVAERTPADQPSTAEDTTETTPTDIAPTEAVAAEPAPGTVTPPTGTPPTGTPPEPAPVDGKPPARTADSDGTGPLSGYQDMSLAQLRGHLRRMSADQVAEVLRHEQAGAARAPFLTLLTNRLTTLEQSGP